MYRTQMIDIYLDNAIFPVIEYETEAQARGYAKERSSHRKCEIRVIDPQGALLDVYEGGEIRDELAA